MKKKTRHIREGKINNFSSEEKRYFLKMDSFPLFAKEISICAIRNQIGHKILYKNERVPTWPTGQDPARGQGRAGAHTNIFGSGRVRAQLINKHIF